MTFFGAFFGAKGGQNSGKYLQSRVIELNRGV